MLARNSGPLQWVSCTDKTSCMLVCLVSLRPQLTPCFVLRIAACRVFAAGAPAVRAPKDIDTSALPSKLLQEVSLELEAGHFTTFDAPGALTPADFAAIRRILLCELELSERESYLLGSAHLVARLFVASGRNEHLTLSLLVLLETKLRPYLTVSNPSSNAPSLRNDVLLLQDLLQTSSSSHSPPLGQELLAHFAQVAFDVVDLGDVISTWFSGLFAASFPAEFCLRAVDLILFSAGTAGASAK